jgi:hypothetical protein
MSAAIREAQMSNLHIARNLDLPIELMTLTTAILGIRNSGKTNTAGVFVEELLSQGQQTVDMLNVVIARGGEPVSCEEIGREVGIDHTGGHFSNTIGPLSTLGLIRRSQGMIYPTEILFPPGVR